MLAFLKVKNFAIIDELEIEFKEGLNVITGETGAGKSIIINAVSALHQREDPDRRCQVRCRQGRDNQTLPRGQCTEYAVHRRPGKSEISSNRTRLPARKLKA